MRCWVFPISWRPPGENETATALFELHSGSTVIKIELEVDLTVNNPYVAAGGTVTGVPSTSRSSSPGRRLARLESVDS